jgi:hypothetical protein
MFAPRLPADGETTTGGSRLLLGSRLGRPAAEQLPALFGRQRRRSLTNSGSSLICSTVSFGLPSARDSAAPSAALGVTPTLGELAPGCHLPPCDSAPAGARAGVAPPAGRHRRRVSSVERIEAGGVRHSALCNQN